MMIKQKVMYKLAKVLLIEKYKLTDCQACELLDDLLTDNIHDSVELVDKFNNKLEEIKNEKENDC